MSSESHEQIAVEHVESAKQDHKFGRLDRAIEHMRDAVVLYATADSAAAEESESRVRARAAACRLCAEYLTENEQFAEAANIYQQAVDQYSRLNSEEAEQQARTCAKTLLECIDMLRARPYDRLNLLVAKYEQRQRQHAAQPGSEKLQAECAGHIARIFQRRERFEQSVERYMEAAALYYLAEPEDAVQLAIAECYHRAGGLQAYKLGNDNAALEMYRKAIVLYLQFEPEVYGEQPSRLLCERAVREIEKYRKVDDR